MKSSKTVVVVPAYNEQEKIFEIVKKIKRFADKIIVVDDGSADKTAEFAKNAGAHVISYRKNKGKGYALRLGFKKAFKSNPSVVITLDADGQHRPEEIPEFINALKNCDMVVGSRFLGKIRTSKTNIFGNIGLRFGVNLLSFGLNSEKWLTDTESGYRAYRTSALKKLNLKGERFEIEAEIVLEAARKKLKIKEVPITVPYKVKGVTVLDGLKNGFYVFSRWLVG